MSGLKQIMYGFYNFAERGDWHKALETALGVVSSYWAVRDALKQLEHYARDKNIARELNLKAIPNVTDGVPGGTVALRRLLVVFHGGQVVCREEV